MNARFGFLAGAVALAIGLLGFGSGCATTAAAAARGQWYEVRTARFQLWTDGDPAQGRALVEDLERFHHVALATTTAEERDVAPPMRIFLAKDSSSFDALSQLEGPLAKGVGVFKASPRGLYAIVQPSIIQSSRPGGTMTGRSILFHEYSHYIQALAGPRTPSWYNEGFAEYMATTEFSEGSYTIGCAPLYRTVGMRHMEWIPMEKIFESGNVAALSRFGKRGGTSSDAYAQSWYTFHYFSRDQERQRVLRDYLRLWSSGVPSMEAAQRAFGMNAAQLDAAIKEYVQLEELDCVTVKPKFPLEVPPISTRPLTSGEAHYYVGDLLLNTFGPTDMAIELLNEALKSSKQDAKTGFSTLISLAVVNLALADQAEGAAADAATTKARGYLEEARKLDPDNPEVFLIEGETLRTQAERLKQSNADEAKRLIQQARPAYRKAIKADETLGVAYYGLGLTYLVDDNGSKEAQVVLEAAAYLLPLELGIPWALARVHAERGHTLEALPPLEYVLIWSQDEKRRTQAKALLDSLRGPVPTTH